MDSESLDRCIQTALSDLYPPFQATSPTVLCQVLKVVESCYRRDGLGYLIHFLLPAKQFLANLKQDACGQYCGQLLLHKGWPLCVHEKVVVQLCPLEQHLLHPGDFYLLVSPPATVPPPAPPPREHSAFCRDTACSSPRLLLCSLSAGSRHVEQEVSELDLQTLFSMAWLDSVNREREQRGAPRLERCLLSAHGDVFRVPWEDLVYPQFISRPRTSLKESVEDGDALIRDTDSSRQEVNLLQSAASSEIEDSEGEYVELTELPRFSPQKGSLTQTIRARTSTPHTHSPHTPHSHTPHTPHTHTPHTPHTPHTHSPHTHTPHTHSPHTHTLHTHSPHTPHSHTPHTPHTHTPHTHTPHTHSPHTHTPHTHSPHTHTPHTHSPHTPQTHTPHTHSPHTPQTHTPQTHSPHTHSPHTPETHTPHTHSPHTSQTHTPCTPQTHTPHTHSPHTPQTHTPRTPQTHTPQTHTPQTHSPHTHSPHTPQTHTPQTHSPHTPKTYTPQTHSPHTPQTHTPHTPQTHSPHTPQTHTPHTHTAAHRPHNANTHSSWPSVEVSSSTRICPRLIEENLNQDSCGSIILTPITRTSSSAPPEVEGTSSWTSHEPTGGTDSGRKLNTEPGSCRELSEEEEVEEEEQGGKGEIELKEEEKELMERQKGMHECVVSDVEDEGKEEKQLVDAKCRKDEYLLNESEEMEEALDEQGDAELEEGAEEVEVEEQVQGTIVKQSQERREEEQVMEGGAEKEERHSKDSYSESSTQHKHSEDSYFENNMQRKHSEDSYPENTQHKDSKDSYSENNALETQSVDYFAENRLQTPSGDSYIEKTQHKQSEDSYSEKTQHKHSKDSYSEKTQHKHSEDSYSEKTQHKCCSESYFENTQHKSEESSTAEMDPDSLWTDPKGSEKRQETQEDEDEEQHSCGEVGRGGTASSEELQTEGPTSPPGPSPAEPEPQLDQSAASTVPVRLTQSSQSSQSSFYRVLLNSGALCVPGTRDRSGRALLTVCTSSTVWSNPDCDSAELLRLLLYYTSTLRKKVGALGMTVLVDARQAPPVPLLFSALRSLQDHVPGSINSVSLLVNKDVSLGLDKPAATQVEVFSSLKSLLKLVELQQLPVQFGGSFMFSQSSWLCFRSRVEQLTNQCEDVIKLLQKTINILQTTPLPAAAQDAELLLSRYQALMRSVLADSRLVQLQQEGGASLSRLRREESSVAVTADYRAAVETVETRYEQVDELLHRLVTMSNARTQELHFILDFRGLESGFTQVSSWLQEVGDVRLKSLDEAHDSLELLNQSQRDFKEFHSTAYEVCRRGKELLSRLDCWGDMSSADLQVYEIKVRSFCAQLQDFSLRVNTTGQNIERAVGLYRSLDQAYGWALEGMRHLAGVSMEDCTLPDKCQAVIGCLEDFQRQHPPIPDGRFQEMKVAAGELRGERGLRQWSFAWAKCQETKKMFDRKMEVVLRTRDSAHRPRDDSTHLQRSDPSYLQRSDSAHRPRADSTHLQRTDSALSRSSTSSRRTLSGLLTVHDPSCPPKEDHSTSPSPHNTSSLLTSTSSPITPQRTPLLQRLLPSASSESADRVDMCSSSPSLAPSSLSSSTSSSLLSSCRRQQLRKTRSFDCPPTPEVVRPAPCPRVLSEPVHRGNTGVFIRGLEVSSLEATDRTLYPRTAARGWAGPGLHTPRTPGTHSTPRTSNSPATESRPRGSKMRHVVEEMVTTERDYVRSLRYIIHHYFPEMDRADLPQDLRGKRSVVFGNLEKLLDFHSQFFLRELEACWKHPLRVPHCFLRHEEQFGLYALYSKNKPKSDALLANHGNSFFRRKQVELADKMDLSSYLLKPVQRMSKYALLLTDLIKEVGEAQEAELATLQAATNMVKFQLRHGNDLLAMDAIRDCDVNLKEQGQLIRQDEFTVWTGRRRCQRHIFLFEELVLFSKPKKVEVGLDVFIYKHSFKTADVGLTESTGDNGLRFEIWFRRRTSKNQTFILQAGSSEVKHAWTTGIARILWTQATRNKETRLKEMVSMGVGNKPFLDIKPSDAAISDRAVHYIMKSRGARTRSSIAVSAFDHSQPFKGLVTSDPAASGPSSAGLLGPLNLHMYSQNLRSAPAAQTSFITSSIEEDEQDTSSQPSMTTESSGSSSRGLSGSTGSDSGCVSSHLQEVLPEEPSPPCQLSYSSPHSSSPNILLSRHFISAKPAPVIGPSTIM